MSAGKWRSALRMCRLDHGGEGNSATVYGHHGSVRVCIRVRATDTWVFDPAWEDEA